MIKFIAIFIDLFTAILFAIVALVFSPLTVLRGADRMVGYIRLLLPKALLATGVRALMDWQFGNLDRSVSQMEAILSYFEPDPTDKNKQSMLQRKLVEDLYSAIAHAYIRSGHIDDAMVVLIRANSSLGIRRLRGLGELDARTAHIIRASIATGKLLDDNSTASLTISSKAPKTERMNSTKRSGATKENNGDKQIKKTNKPRVLAFQSKQDRDDSNTTPS